MKLVSCHAKVATGVKAVLFHVSVQQILGTQKEVNVTGLLESADVHKALLDQGVKISAHLGVMDQIVN